MRFKLPSRCGASLRGNRKQNYSAEDAHNRAVNKSNMFKKPQKCPSKTFQPVITNKHSIYSNYQEVKIHSIIHNKSRNDRVRGQLSHPQQQQQQKSFINLNGVPILSTLILQSFLCGKVAPGNQIIANGILIQRFMNAPRQGQRPKIQLALLVNDIMIPQLQGISKSQLSQSKVKGEIDSRGYQAFWQRCSQNIFKGINQLINLVDVNIFGNQFIKKGILLSLIGGIR